MIKASSLPPGTPIYRYVDKSGENVAIASERLRQHCELVQPERFWTPVRRSLGLSFIQENVVDPARVKALTREHLASPIIFCQDGKTSSGAPDAYLVDGHHRYARAALVRQQLILCWLLPEHFWKPFQIEGLRPMTQEELRSAPVLPRGY